MIISTVKGNVMEAKEKHVCFAVNTEGANDAGLAGAVTRQWPELRYVGASPMGHVYSKKIGERVFHAIVCHSLGEDGWDGSPGVIRKRLDEVGFEAGEPVACVRFGAGPVGRLQGADADANLKAIDESSARVVIYDL